MTATADTPADTPSTSTAEQADHADQGPGYPMERTCPYQMPTGYELLRAAGPLSQVSLYDGRQVWLVAGNAEGRALLPDPRLSSNTDHPDFPFLTERLGSHRFAALPLIGTDDPEHARQRKLLTSGFGIRRIAALRPHIERTAEALLDRMLAEGDRADLVPAYTLPLASDSTFALLGVPEEDRPCLDAHSRRALFPADGDDADSPALAFQEILGYLRDLIARRSRVPGDGLIDDMIASARDHGGADLEGLVTICSVLMVGGNESTSSTIATSVLALLEHPDQLAALRNDASLTAGAVEELTRLISVTDGLQRVATADIEIAGRTIKEGDGVIISTMLMNRDPSAWEDPHLLDIRRKAGRHVAFGYGIHQCVGQNLARAEMEIALNTLLRRVPSLRLAVPPEQVRGSVPHALLGGVAELPIAW
ncbi:cytochrome P450 [Streptomyces sp. JV176]|uniref:cytochrome P450 n=1 Tax=unclassified Streptomyces TaxID=2593676 RepID=UPI002E767BBC|nr:cytochrome P450 [Streptomyces sp. JV176]MEE1800534.1 cytochrome P450 [Streptomyces sp. JV176]